MARVIRRQARPRRTVFAPRLVIMAKSPRAGFAKRRLGRAIGDVAAIRVYRSALAHTLRRLGPATRWRTLLAITPDRDAAAPFWAGMGTPANVRRLPQGNGDLGARMQRLFRLLPPGPVIIVGSDIAGLGQRQVAQAFRLLGRADAVFGPATDGGYWLIGLRRAPRLLAPFAGVRWSTATALADTLANLKGKNVALATALDDIDSEAAYRAHRAAAERLLLPTF